MVSIYSGFHFGIIRSIFLSFDHFAYADVPGADRVFGCDSSTKQVYEEGAKEVTLSVVSGINGRYSFHPLGFSFLLPEISSPHQLEKFLTGDSFLPATIFAYGQTSSGKTYTMSGVTEYTVADIFDYINKVT